MVDGGLGVRGRGGLGSRGSLRGGLVVARAYCGLVLDRDVNAARNTLRKGIGMVRAESKPVRDSTTEEKPVMHVGSLNQEAHLFRGG